MRSLFRLWHFASLLIATPSNALPYNPTSIFVTSYGSRVYIFSPTENYQASLSIIQLSDGIKTSSLDAEVLYSGLPFLRDNKPLPYTPILNTNEDITVISGDCQAGADAVQIWRFEPGKDNFFGNGTWSHLTAQGQQKLGTSATQAGAQYLAHSFSFTSSTNSEEAADDIYIFGGMCPEKNSNKGNWINAATYSNLLVEYSPAGNLDDTYEIGAIPNGGLPIAQAGATLTPLSLTFFENATGGSTIQQQDFVLVGGHTGYAFINTSELALFSLPQQTWSFVGVEQAPSPSGGLAMRNELMGVSPRSGHSAVLSEDGASIIVFGGWVGDLNTPAEPQLAVLNLGSGYGGNGDWKWTIPRVSKLNAPDVAGIYGHGAAMLPGGIMMITGGYELPNTVSGRPQGGLPQKNRKTFLYDTISHAWMDSYDLPGSVRHADGSHSGHDQAQKIGLGVGLGLGATLLIILLVLYYWYCRRLKRKERDCGRALLTQSDDACSIGPNEQHMYNDLGFDGRGGGDGPLIGRVWPASNSVGEHSRAPEMQHTTSMFVNVPSPTRGLRRGFGGRGYQYHQAPRFDENRLSRGGGVTNSNIHTITETVEEEESIHKPEDRNSIDEGLTDVEKKLQELEQVLTISSPQDPFSDPGPAPLGSHPVSPDVGADTMAQAPVWLKRVSIPPRKPVPVNADNSPDWIASAAEDEQTVHDDGRTSPTKTDERTSSSMSNHSVVSSNSITRSMSTRTGALLVAALAGNRLSTRPSSSSDSQSDGRSHTMSSTTTNGRKSPFLYPNSSQPRSTQSSPTHRHRPGGGGGGDADSFRTARTTFAHLQAEGESLLGGRPMMDRDDPYQRALAAHTGSTQPAGSVQSSSYNLGLNAPLGGRRRQGWVGSLRRALNAVSGAASDRSFSLTSAKERYVDDPHTASSSPMKEKGAYFDTAPRRTVSDGNALLRSKRGRQDWETYHDAVDGLGDPHGVHHNGDWGEPRSSLDRRQAEEDWDVEGAVTRRDVQVLFTVPKTRLRVVNDDMDRASLRSASDSGALSRTGSVTNSMHRKESVRGMRARSEGDRAAPPMPLLTTAEDDEMEEEKRKQ